MAPLLLLERVAQLEQRLLENHQEVLQQLTLIRGRPLAEQALAPVLAEQKELLLEVLQEMQPPASLQISQALGLPTPPRSPRSSAS